MGRWVVPLAALALPLCLSAEVLPIRSYSTADGLAADNAGPIVADSHGFVWFCTPEGLSRFDGYRFVNFGVAEGLPHQTVNALLETRAGEYLLGTPRGICQFREGGRGRFTTYLPGNSPAEKYVTALLQDSRGRIWCGTFAGLFEMLNGHTFRRQPLRTPQSGTEQILIEDVIEDSVHNLWVATRAGVYVVGKDGGVEHIAMEERTQNVRALMLDRNGRIWAGTQSGLVLMRDLSYGRGYGIEKVYREAGTVHSLDITSLAEGPDGAIWAGTSSGILRWFPANTVPKFHMLTRADGLIDRQVNELAMDHAGNMWAATEAAGVMQIQPSGFTTFRERDGLATDRVWSLLADRAGVVLAVTAAEGHDAVNRFDGVKFHALSVKGFSEHPPWGNRILLQARTGEWWAATGAGLCRYAPARTAALGERKPLACYARHAAVNAIFEDSKGSIWASAELNGTNRLLRWDQATQAVSFIGGGRNAQESVAAFAEDRDNNMWVALGAGDLLRYGPTQCTRFKHGESVLTGEMGELFVDSAGRLWVASRMGLGLIDHPNAPRLSMRVYKTADGLASDAVCCIAEDKAGRIYASTLKGVDRLDPRTGHVKHFSTADGLAHGQIRMALTDGAGNIWFATTQGLSRLSPSAGRMPAIPSVRVTGLGIGRGRYPVSQVGDTRIMRGDLQPSQNQFRVTFVGFSDEPEANLRYTYKLEGGEPGWQGPGRDHEANYPGLEAGRYRFLVKAVNSEGLQSGTPAEVDFVILPPVWRRWWFEALALAAAACLVFAAYRRRLQGVTARVRLLYEERLDERTRIARELHDTLLQNLAGVSLQLDGVAKRIFLSSPTVASQIRDVRQQVDASFREARQKVQDLRSPMLQGRALPPVLRESLDQIVAGRPIRLCLTVTGQPHPLGEGVDEAVLRIGQEAVANAVRHAGASEIQVSLAYEERSVDLRVKDDGRGFDPGEAGRRLGHFGLRNMQERAHQIGARWKVTSAAGHGTEIEAMVPLAGNE